MTSNEAISSGNNTITKLLLSQVVYIQCVRATTWLGRHHYKWLVWHAGLLLMAFEYPLGPHKYQTAIIFQSLQ